MDYLDLILYPNILKYEFRLRSVWISVLINHAIQSWVDWLVTRTFILHRRSIDVFLLNSDSVTYATGVNLQRWNPDIMKAVCNKLTALFNYKNITEMGLLPHKKGGSRRACVTHSCTSSSQLLRATSDSTVPQQGRHYRWRHGSKSTRMQHLLISTIFYFCRANDKIPSSVSKFPLFFNFLTQKYLFECHVLS